MQKTRKEARRLRHWRLRSKISGTPTRPRMAVCFTGKHACVQFVDDLAGHTLASASTREKEFRADGKHNHSNVETAKKLGDLAAKRAQAKKISAVVFDRAGFRYHGRVAALAEAARAGGLKF